MEDKTQNALVQQEQNGLQMQGLNAFQSLDNFKDAQRMASLICASSLVPENFRGQGNICNAVIALDMANRLGANPLMIMQNIYIVYGKPAWSAAFLISCVNKSGKFSPLRYKKIGEKGTDSYGYYAWAKDKLDGEILEGPEVTIRMAKSEGWYDKKGSKWVNMPGLMLRYRAATFFTRLFAPELTMGLQTTDEIIDITPDAEFGGQCRSGGFMSGRKTYVQQNQNTFAQDFASSDDHDDNEVVDGEIIDNNQSKEQSLEERLASILKEKNIPDHVNIDTIKAFFESQGATWNIEKVIENIDTIATKTIAWLDQA